MKDYNTIIIGAGASGLFCAKNLQEKNIDLLVLEKMKSPGKKLLITGGGMCNLTRDEEVYLMLKHYGNKGKFLGKAFSTFSPKDTIKWFEKRNLKLFTREDKKIFPISKKAQDVVDVLFDKTYPITFNYSVNKIQKKDGFFVINDEYKCVNLVIATGGISYPTTGSTGDGYEIARKLNHKIIEVKPSLTSLKITSEDLSFLEGISLKNINVSIPQKNKINKFYKGQGDLLFTRFGLSGPVILDLSRYCYTNQKIYIGLNKKIDRVNNSQKLSNHFKKETGLPSRLITYILNSLEIKDLPCNQISNHFYDLINAKLKKWEMSISLKGTAKVAMSSEGGVDTKEIDNNTFESKICKNLFFTGEVIDYSGDCGGYNLQACWSISYSIAKAINL